MSHDRKLDVTCSFFFSRHLPQNSSQFVSINSFISKTTINDDKSSIHHGDINFLVTTNKRKQDFYFLSIFPSRTFIVPLTPLLFSLARHFQ